MKIKDLYHYKEAYFIYKVLKDKSHPNLIITYKYPKKQFITTILNEYFNIKHNYISDDNIKYEYNNIYYYFNLNNIKVDIKDTFIGVIKNISKTKNFYKDNSNYIILDNYESINPILESKLKIIIEKSLLTTKYILLCNNYDKINYAIKSRCIQVRIKPLSFYDKEYVFRNYKFNDNFNEILKNNDNLYLIEKLLEGFIDPYEKIIKKCINIFNSNIDNKILNIKELSYKILCANIDIPLLQQKLIEYYLKSNISPDKKMLIIKKNTDINYLMINSYKDIIYIEYYLLEIYNILND